MKKMIIIVLIFITFVMAFSFFLVKLYTPTKTPFAFEKPGFIFQENCPGKPCTVRLAGTMSTYKLDMNPPSFFTNPLSLKEGLIIDGKRYIDRLVIGWPEKKDNCVTFVFNGSRFVTNRNFEFIIAFLPNREYGTNFIAVSPAESEESAKALIQSLSENPEIQSLCPGVFDNLTQYYN